MAEAWGDDLTRRLEDQLLQRRTVLLRGPIDDQAATRLAAQLMWLDGAGDGAVDLQLDSPGGPLPAAFSLVDTVEALGVPVHARCLGRVEGSALGLLAVCAVRSAGRHTRFHLCEPRSELSGSAAQLERRVQDHQRALADFTTKLAAATGRPLEHLEAELATGRWLDAEEAVAFGLIDEIAAPGDGPARPPGPPMGFGPPPG